MALKDGQNLKSRICAVLVVILVIASAAIYVHARSTASKLEGAYKAALVSSRDQAFDALSCLVFNFKRLQYYASEQNTDAVGLLQPIINMQYCADQVSSYFKALSAAKGSEDYLAAASSFQDLMAWAETLYQKIVNATIHNQSIKPILATINNNSTVINNFINEIETLQKQLSSSDPTPQAALQAAKAAREVTNTIPVDP